MWAVCDILQEFGGNTNRESERYHYFLLPFVARYIRFHPTEWFNHISMRAGIIGCPHQGRCHGSIELYIKSFSSVYSKDKYNQNVFRCWMSCRNHCCYTYGYKKACHAMKKSSTRAINPISKCAGTIELVETRFKPIGNWCPFICTIIELLINCRLQSHKTILDTTLPAAIFSSHIPCINGRSCELGIPSIIFQISESKVISIIIICDIQLTDMWQPSGWIE